MLFKGKENSGCSQPKGRKRTPFTELYGVFTRHRFLLCELVGRDFAVKYRRSYFGLVWVVLNPLLQMMVLSAVFSYIFRFSIEHYPVYLILGQVTFGFFAEATQAAAVSVVGAGQLIRKVYIPKCIFPLSKVAFSFFNYLLTFLPVAAVFLFYGIPLTANILFLPLILAALFLFTLGVGYVLALLQVYMRDVQYLYGIVLMMWTYLTPVFYSLDSVSPGLQRLMKFNPMYLYIALIRQILLYGEAPSVSMGIGALLWGVAAFCLGTTLFFRRQDSFILYI